jgi:uncharacterized membrane protein
MDLSAPLPVLLLAFAPAIMWGFTPIIEKRALSAGGTPYQAATTVVFVDSAVYLLALALVVDDPFGDLTLGTVALFAAAGALGTAMGRVAIFVGNDRVGASVSSAVLSARPLFATALAVGFIGESLSVPTAVGVGVVVVGLSVLSVAKGGDIEGWRPRDLLVPVLAAALFAVGNVARRWGLTTTNATALEAVAINEVTALLVLVGLAAASGEERLFGRPRRSYLVFGVSGLITAVALLSLFTAFAHPAGRVVVVEPLISTAPLFTVFFSWLWLGDLERVTRGVVAGAVLVVVGAALVTAGPALAGLVGG